MIPAAAAVLAFGAGWWLGRRRSAAAASEAERGLRLLSKGDWSASLRLPADASLAQAFEAAREEILRSLGERKREAARERMKIETLVQNIPDGVVLTDLRGDVVYINAAARDILGAQETPGTKRDPAFSPEVRMRIQQILKSRTQREVLELPVRRPGGEATGFFKTHVALSQTAGGADLGVILVLRDVTAERGLDALKEEFFQSVAHDLRAPLFAVQGYLRLLVKSMQPDARQKGYLDAIAQSCEKLTLFIQDTLDSARIQTGQMKLSIAPLEPGPLLQKAVALFRPLADERGITLELRVPPEAPAGVEADERLLERVLHNLLSNALKFTPRGGRVVARLSQAGPDQAEFAVSDTGPGVPPELRAQLFERFKPASGDGRLGFGLGLSICARIVKLHGGEIWAAAASGGGAEFVFRLPLRALKTAEKTLQ